MQISSSHSGFNFQSIYKSVVTRQVTQAAATPAANSASAASENEDKTEQMNREALLLKAAQKSAERTATHCESLPDL